MQLEDVPALRDRIRAEVAKQIVGQDQAVDLLVVALLSQGHVLFEGVPGVAKTLLVRAFAASLDLAFGRIQFTPDLMPGDVLGTNIFNFQTNSFQLTKGPIFTELLLADEINRTPPKTQAALLEAMHERKVTIDGTPHDLGDGFMVIATQNPLEHQGTYPLPEAQLDRFLFKHVMDYPSRNEERQIVGRHGQTRGLNGAPGLGLTPVTQLADLQSLRALVDEVRLSDEVIDYIVDLIRSSREHPGLIAGASPRAATMLARAARALAALDGRDYGLPDDVKTLTRPLLRHRVILSPSAEMDRLTADQIVDQIVDQTPAPR